MRRWGAHSASATPSLSSRFRREAKTGTQLRVAPLGQTPPIAEAVCLAPSTGRLGPGLCAWRAKPG